MQANVTVAIPYVPQSQKQWGILLKHLSNPVLCAEIAQRQQNAAYLQIVAALANVMRSHFAQYPAGRIVKECPWVKLGVRDKYIALAVQNSIPGHYVLQDIHAKM